ncbi:hypothetical protein [uncultured Dokdonia sp.]|uniref:hypothetical protein n=1 Tax=uncultured Dokdonia sp. TaxID=575653 RepID=UPI00261D8245|nr:hypothetical protein [uncultured Dokdonia sp.]
MKKITILFLLISISLYTSCSSDADPDPGPETQEFPENIFTGNVTLETQQEVNEFGANNYTIIEGQVVIGKLFDEDNVSDLTPLIALKEVRLFSLRIHADLITSFEGLNNLEKVTGLTISTTQNLINFEGLDNLTTIGNPGENFRFNIDTNIALTSFEGLESLTTLNTTDFIFGNNPVLSSLNGLENVTTLPAVLLGQNATCAGSSTTVLCGNPMLTDFCAIQNAVLNTDFVLFSIELNGYNPTLEDFANGDCSI